MYVIVSPALPFLSFLYLIKGPLMLLVDTALASFP